MLEEVGHAQWVFVIPKMLRPYFLHHRELLGGLARAAWETVLELMCAAAGDEGMRPGMVAVVQTAGDLANWHPHVHALVSRGGWTQDVRRRIDFPGWQNHEVSRTGCLAPTLFAANKVACLASPPNVSRGRRRKADAEHEGAVTADTGAPSRAARAETRDARALRRSWAQLIKRIYEVDPLVCPSCGSEMKVIAFIIEHDVVDAILRCLKRKEERRERAPPS